MSGIVTKDECEKTLRAYQQRQDEMKSDDGESCSWASSQDETTPQEDNMLIFSDSARVLVSVEMLNEMI